MIALFFLCSMKTGVWRATRAASRKDCENSNKSITFLDKVRSKSSQTKLVRIRTPSIGKKFWNSIKPFHLYRFQVKIWPGWSKGAKLPRILIITQTRRMNKISAWNSGKKLFSFQNPLILKLLVSLVRSVFFKKRFGFFFFFVEGRYSEKKVLDEWIFVGFDVVIFVCLRRMFQVLKLIFYTFIVFCTSSL